MKLSRLILVLVCFAQPVLRFACARADLWWDVNGATAGSSSSTHADGDWSGTNWTTNSAGTSATQAWVPGETAVFNAGTNATFISDVVLSQNISVSAIRIEDGYPSIGSSSANPVLTFTNGLLVVDVPYLNPGSLSGASANALYGPTNGVITKTGPGQFYTSRDQTSFAGKWIVNEGILSFPYGFGTVLGVLPAATVPDTITINNGAGLFGSAPDKFGITLGPGGGGFTYLDQSMNGSMSWSGPITGNSGGPLIIQVHGFVGIENSNNNYDGDTILKDGIVELLANDVIPNTSPVKISGASTLDLHKFDETVRSISGIADSRITFTVDAHGHQPVLTIQSPAGETIDSQISGSGKIVKNGTGAATLTNSNSFSQFVLNSGVVGIGNASALGTSSGLLTINGGAIANTSSTQKILPMPVSINGDFGVDDSLSATPGRIIFGGTATVGATRTITVADNATLALYDLRQSVAGVGLTKAGGGTLEWFGVFSPAINPLTGQITVLDGRLQINNASFLGTGANPLELAGGTISITSSRDISTKPIANPTNVTGDSAITTTSTESVVNLKLSNNSISGTGKLTFRNDAPSGTGVFQPQFSGGGTNFAAGPIEIANGPFGRTVLHATNSGGTQTFGNVISGTGAFSRDGAINTTAVTVFSAANTYSGGTMINDGTLLVNNTSGSGTGTGPVTVRAGAKLGGTGSIGGPVSNKGQITPGPGIGTLTMTDNVTFETSGHLLIEVSAASADKLVVAGNLDLSSSDFLDVTGSGSGPWVIATYGSLSGQFDFVTSGYVVDYATPGQIILNSMALAGDYNSDGVVEAADFAVWRKTPDAYSGQAGYSTWRANYGRTLAGGGSAADASAVPEPVGIAGVCAAVWVVAGWRPLRRRDC